MAQRSTGRNGWLRVPAVNRSNATPRHNHHQLLSSGAFCWNGALNKGNLMLRAEVSTVGDSQEVSSIHSGFSTLTTLVDRLLDSKCKCGAKEQLILCKSRLEHLISDDVKRRRCAVNRGKLAAAGRYGNFGKFLSVSQHLYCKLLKYGDEVVLTFQMLGKHVYSQVATYNRKTSRILDVHRNMDFLLRGQAALRILSDDLSVAVTEARGELKRSEARLDEEERFAGELRKLEVDIEMRESALVDRRDEVASLRSVEESVQEKLRKCKGEHEKEKKSLQEQLMSRRATKRKLNAAMSAAKSNLATVRRRVRSCQHSLEVAHSDLDVYEKVLDEVPDIMTDLTNGERETWQKREDLERQLVVILDRLSGTNDRMGSIRSTRALGIDGRKDCLRREKNELDQLAQRLDAMQEYIGDFRQRRQSGSSAAGKETAMPDESLDELAQMERDFFANAAQLQANERELEALARKTDKLKEEFIARQKRKTQNRDGWRRTACRE